MKPYLTLIIGAATGIAGFFATTFWMQPILRYRELKGRIAGRLIYFSDVYEDENFEYLKRKSCEDPEIDEVVQHNKARMNEKCLECRKLSGELESVIMYLPRWYMALFLTRRGEDPLKAKENLIGLANARDSRGTHGRVRHIRKLLKLPGWKELKSDKGF